MEKRYDAKQVEQKIQKFWSDNNIFKFDPRSNKPIFSIDVPPPYASAGHLHVGHALHYTQFEFIARYKRMRGYNVYFAPCFDNNGLPTEKYVEEKYKITKSDITRPEFIKLCREEASKVEKEYSEKVFKRLGHSYDWSLLYTTIDPESQRVAQTSFLRLIKQGDCYRKEEPTLWCPYHQTALAQAEVEDLKRTTKLNYIYFKLKDSDKKIEIATTRPELLPACVGIFVHPEDERYKDIIGKKAIVPLFNYEVEIMTDEKVDKEFGSGIVMVCTFGDKTDIEWWKKHNLDLKIIVTKDGKLNELAGKYKGKDFSTARQEILEDLDKQGFLIKQEPLEQTVGVCWRCSTPIEFIVTKQWFIKTIKYKKELIEQGRKINWYPEFYRKRYEDWINNLGWDWCISRQRFYGVPIPVWYCKKCGTPIFPDESELPVDPVEKSPNKKCKCGSDEFEPEYDVFDTWMTSSMTPQITIRWLEKPDQFDKLFPLSLRPQAQDIIRTWAFYTILKSYLHFKKIPWYDIALGTFVLDEKGRGMSKSKGNVVWADELLDKYDVDSFRYWAGNATWGTDLSFKEKELIAGKKFITKLWNASRFVIMNLKDYKPQKTELYPIDKWILSKLDDIIEQATDLNDRYETGKAKRLVEQFFWKDFCDNYIEIVKHRLYNEDHSTLAAKYTLYTVLLKTLKLFAPIVPHITEEIYQNYFKQHEGDISIHVSKWPEKENVEKTNGDIVIEVISKIRKYKHYNKLPLNSELNKVIIISKEDISEFKDDIKGALKIKEIEFKKGEETNIEII
ncbi:MAG: valine--tRNA ligase [Candidatus Aenigmarchaeota archaeon]|nr:valine--tRNA ligase [Candidatus Aenigmarchaeota archaeon]